MHSRPLPQTLKRRTLTAVLVLLMLLLAACAPTGQAPADGVANEGQPVTLRVQTSIDFYAEEADAGVLAYRAAHERFLEEHPNIQVEFEIVPGFELYRQFIVAAEAGNAPDITYQGAANTYTLAVSGHVLELNQFMEGHPYLNPENLQSAILAVETVDGKYYGIPTTTDVRLLYYRKDLLAEAGLDPDQPPTTREELIEYAQALTQDTDGDGTIDQWGYGFLADNTLHTPHMWLTHVWAGGGDLVDEEGRAIYDSEAGIAAAQFYYDLVNTYKVSPPEVIATDYDASVRALVSGHYAMAILGSWSWPNDLLGALGEEKIGWAKVPPPEGGQDATFSGGWSWMISSQSEHPAEAWAYLEAINSEEVALELGKLNIPTRQSIINHPELEGTFVAEAGQYASEAAHGNPQVVTTQALFDGIRQALQDIIQGNADPAAAIQAAAADYNAQYAGQ